jgi:phage shock protein A
MQPAALIERELAAAETAWKNSNEGKARVCARRAVARAAEEWLERRSTARWPGDAMEHLRQIQQNASFPLPIREAAKRLSTKVPQRHTAPFTTDPINDARIIIAHLSASDL